MEESDILWYSKFKKGIRTPMGHCIKCGFYGALHFFGIKQVLQSQALKNKI